MKGSWQTLRETLALTSSYVASDEVSVDRYRTLRLGVEITGSVTSVEILPETHDGTAWLPWGNVGSETGSALPVTLPPLKFTASGSVLLSVPADVNMRFKCKATGGTPTLRLTALGGAGL